jgi:hypothetical protein
MVTRYQDNRPTSSAFWRGFPEHRTRSVLEYVSTGAPGKRSQNPKSAGVFSA